MRVAFVGKLDRTNEFLLLTPAGAVKTRCVRRLEGLAILEFVCWQPVECDSQECAAGTNDPTGGSVGQ